MYLIVGASGYLGSYLIQEVLHKTDERIVATARTVRGRQEEGRVCWAACDIGDFASVEKLSAALREIGEPIKVVVCAAYHHPDEVQKKPKIGWHINVTSLSYFLNQLDWVQTLYYPSTDSVYGESANGYHFKESDRTAPVNLYGRQKVVAEQLVLGAGHHVVRYPFLIGPSLIPGQPHFYDKVARTILDGRPMEMFHDSYRSSLDFQSAASYLIDLIECGEQMPPVVNLCGDKDLSKYDIGIMIAKKHSVCESLIVPVSIGEAQGIFEVSRARSTLMDNRMIKELLKLDSILLKL